MSRPKAQLRLPSGAPRDPGAVDLYESLATLPRPWPLYLVEMYETAVATAVATGATYWVPEDAPSQVQAAARRAAPLGRRAWMVILRWGERAVRAWMADMDRPRPRARTFSPGPASVPPVPVACAKMKVAPRAVPRVAAQNQPVPGSPAKPGVAGGAVEAPPPPVPGFRAKTPVGPEAAPRVTAQNQPVPVLASIVGVDPSACLDAVPASPLKTGEEPEALPRVAAQNPPVPVSPPKAGVQPSPRVRYTCATRARRLSARLQITYPKGKTHRSHKGGENAGGSEPDPATRASPARPPPLALAWDYGHRDHGHAAPTLRPACPATASRSAGQASTPASAPAGLEAPQPSPSPAPEPSAPPTRTSAPAQPASAPDEAQDRADLRHLLEQRGLKTIADALDRAGLCNLTRLEAMTEAEVGQVHGIGPKSVTALKRRANIMFQPDVDGGFRPVDDRQRFIWACWRECYDQLHQVQAPNGDFQSGGRDRAAAEALAERYMPRGSAGQDPVAEHGEAFRGLLRDWLASRRTRPPGRLWYANEDLPVFEAKRRQQAEGGDDAPPARGGYRQRERRPDGGEICDTFKTLMARDGDESTILW